MIIITFFITITITITITIRILLSGQNMNITMILDILLTNIDHLDVILHLIMKIIIMIMKIIIMIMKITIMIMIPNNLAAAYVDQQINTNDNIRPKIPFNLR